MKKNLIADDPRNSRSYRLRAGFRENGREENQAECRPEAE